LYNASLSLVDVHIVRTGGFNSFSLRYGGSKRDGGFEIACAQFSSMMADHRDLNFVQCFIISFVDVHIVRTGGFNSFSLSYGGSKRVEGLK
jgi:hypothetical protein